MLNEKKKIIKNIMNSTYASGKGLRIIYSGIPEPIKVDLNLLR